MHNQQEDDILAKLVAQSFRRGLEVHGDLGLDVKTFASRLQEILNKHAEQAGNNRAFAFLSRAHVTDLYLSTACGHGSEAAWRIFVRLYERLMRDVACFFADTRTLGIEIAQSIPGHIFLPGYNSRPRIASYDGRIPLSAWLREIIKNRVLDQQALKAYNFESMSVLEQGDCSTHVVLDALGPAKQYQNIITVALRLAVDKLTSDERGLLISRYLRANRLSAIAAASGIHPSTVTRQISQVQQKLRIEIIAQLCSLGSLGPLSIKECVTDLLNNPAHSILSLLEAAER